MQGIFFSPDPTDFILLGDSSPEPVVFLLGWAGCQDKQLSSYSRLYEDLGCVTVRYTAPADYVFFAPERVRPLARKLLALIAEMSLESSPVFFHVFSNNGCVVYQRMAELMRETKAKGEGEGAGYICLRRECSMGKTIHDSQTYSSYVN